MQLNAASARTLYQFPKVLELARGTSARDHTACLWYSVHTTPRGVYLVSINTSKNLVLPSARTLYQFPKVLELARGTSARDPTACLV